MDFFNEAAQPASSLFRQLVDARQRDDVALFFKDCDVSENDACFLLSRCMFWVDAELTALALSKITDVNKPLNKEGETFLYLAARAGRADIIEVLHAHGADLHQKTTYGDTPMIVAAQCDHAEAIEMLIFLGARPFADKMGCSPKSWAMTDAVKRIFDEDSTAVAARVAAQKAAAEKRRLDEICAALDRKAHEGIPAAIIAPVIPAFKKLPFQGR